MTSITLVLNRSNIGPDCTTGLLCIEGMDQLWYTLEPQGVDQTVKPRSIPAGTYQITLRESPRLGYITPYLLDVQDFSDILIHVGNYPRDTEGCILIGSAPDEEAIDNSKEAFDALMSILSDSSVTSIQIVISDSI